MPHMEPEPSRRTYLLIDGENIDATLGMSVLGQRPSPEQRPRWDRITEFAERTWGQPVTALFFLNATSGQLPMSFIQALLAMGYHPIPLAGSGDPHEQVVAIAIRPPRAAPTAAPAVLSIASPTATSGPRVHGL